MTCDKRGEQFKAVEWIAESRMIVAMLYAFLIEVHKTMFYCTLWVWVLPGRTMLNVAVWLHACGAVGVVRGSYVSVVIKVNLIGYEVSAC